MEDIKKEILEEIEEKEKFRKLDLEPLFLKIKNILKKYVDMSEENYTIIALWILGTYLHKYFETYPFLIFNASKGSGKTRLLKLISTLSKNGELVVNISEAAFFRTAQNKTICIDEFERVTSKEKLALKELLNAAYKKGAKVVRIFKLKGKKREKMVAEEFEVYAPICMANIWGFDDVIEDRSIFLVLEKSNRKDITKLLEMYDSDEDIKEVKERLNELFSDTSDVTLLNFNIIHFIIVSYNNYIINKNIVSQVSNMSLLSEESQVSLEKLLYFYNKIYESQLIGRQLEIFFPILIISLFCNCFEETLKIVEKISQEKKEEELAENRDILLLGFIAKEIEETNEYIAVSEISKKFKEYLENAEWVTNDWVGRALRRLNLVISKRRTSKKREVLINFKKAKEKYAMFDENFAEELIKIKQAQQIEKEQKEKEAEEINLTQFQQNITQNIVNINVENITQEITKVYFTLRDIDIVVTYNNENVNIKIPAGCFVEDDVFGDFKEKIVDLLLQENYIVPFKNKFE